MFDSQYREDWRCAQPAFGAAPHEPENGPVSLLDMAARAPSRRPVDAVARHRLARMEREAADARLPADPDMRNEPAAWPQADALGPSTDGEPTFAPGLRRCGPSKRLIAAFGLIGAVAGGIVAQSLPARYDATAEVRIGTAGHLSALARADDRLRVVTSGIVINKVVDKLGLADDPDFNGTAGNGGLVPLLGSLLLRDDGGAASDAGHRHAMATARLAASLAVGNGSEASTIAVTARTGNGEKSALIANTVAEAVLDTVIAAKPAPAGGEVRTAASDEATRKLDVFLANHGLSSANGAAAADALLDLDGELAAARARKAELNGKIATMRTLGVDGAMGGGLPQEFESAAMADLRTQYLSIKLETDRAAARLGPRNPERIALDTQLSGTRDRIAAELRRIVASLQDELKDAVRTEQDLASRMAQTRLESDDVATLRTLRDAVRVAENAEAALDRTATASIPAAGNAGVVAKAYAPLEPGGPPRLEITFGGLLAGMAAGAGIGLARSRRRHDHSDSPAFPEEADTPDAAAARAARGYAPEAGAFAPPSHPAGPARESAGERLPDPDETAEVLYPPETAMYPVYTDPMHPFPPHGGDYPQPSFQPPAYMRHPYAQQAAMPMQPMPMAAPYPYSPYGPAQPWPMQPQPQMQAMPAGYYPYPHPPHAPHFAGYPLPAPAPQPSAAADPASLEEIRASLREFREAVRELAESRSRRRYF